MPLSASNFARFREGFLAPWEGFRYMLRNPSLWQYGVIPVLLNIVITLTLLLGLLVAVVATADALHPLFPESAWGVLLEVLVWIVLGILALGLTVAACLLLEGILCGYFYGKLCEHVEEQLGIAPDEIRSISLKYQAIDGVRDMAALLLIHGGMLLLGFVPVIGTALAVCGAAYFDCYLFGRDMLDLPLALRGRRRAEKLAFLRRHRPEVLGLGAAVLLFHFLPFLGAVLLTTAATGSVLLHRRLAGKPRRRVCEAERSPEG